MTVSPTGKRLKNFNLFGTLCKPLKEIFDSKIKKFYFDFFGKSMLKFGEMFDAVTEISFHVVGLIKTIILVSSIKFWNLYIKVEVHIKKHNSCQKLGKI